MKLNSLPPSPLSTYIFLRKKKNMKRQRNGLLLVFSASLMHSLLFWLCYSGLCLRVTSHWKKLHTLFFPPLFISNNQSKTLKKTAMESPFNNHTTALYSSIPFFTFTLLIREKVMITIMIIIITSHQPRIFNTSHVKNNTAISAIKIIPITFSCWLTTFYNEQDNTFFKAKKILCLFLLHHIPHLI